MSVHFLAVGTPPHMVVMAQREGRKRWNLLCFGRKRHYRKDGSCAHTEAVLAQLKPSIRKLTRVTPFGAKQQDRDT